jgi:hypothetical protein
VKEDHYALSHGAAKQKVLSDTDISKQGGGERRTGRDKLQNTPQSPSRQCQLTIHRRRRQRQKLATCTLNFE